MRKARWRRERKREGEREKKVGKESVLSQF